jgi:hypothetical protein
MFDRLPRRGITVTVAGIGATLAALLVTGNAWAPPAEGVPNMGVRQSCVAYGQRFKVTGFGFAPGSSVTLSAPLGHYDPFFGGYKINNTTAIADQTGGFSGSLVAPRRRGRPPLSYQPRVIFATGTAQDGGGEGESFDEVLIATSRLCKLLAAGRLAAFR